MDLSLDWKNFIKKKSSWQFLRISFVNFKKNGKHGNLWLNSRCPLLFFFNTIASFWMPYMSYYSTIIFTIKWLFCKLSNLFLLYYCILCIFVISCSISNLICVMYCIFCFVFFFFFPAYVVLKDGKKDQKKKKKKKKNEYTTSLFIIFMSIWSHKMRRNIFT